jgi:hypothetical protein
MLLISNYFNPFEFNRIELVRQSWQLPFQKYSRLQSKVTKNKLIHLNDSYNIEMKKIIPVNLSLIYSW